MADTMTRGRDLGITPGAGTPGSFATRTHTPYEGPDLQPAVTAGHVQDYFAAIDTRPGRPENLVVAEHLLLTTVDATLDDRDLTAQAATLCELADQSGQPVARVAREQLGVAPEQVTADRARRISARLLRLAADADLDTTADAYTRAAVQTAHGFEIHDDDANVTTDCRVMLASGAAPEDIIRRL